MDHSGVVRDETFTLGGLRLHYRDWGDLSAPPVVLLHAYLQHARSWDTVAQGLADRYRVLALDQRGFGESDWAADYHELRLVADLAGFLDTLGLSTVTLVGFSIGGSAAITYAQLFPDRVARLVAFECFTDPDVAEDAPYHQAMLTHLTLLRTLPEHFATLNEAVAAFRPLAPSAAEPELRHWLEGGLRQSADGVWSWRADPVFRRPAPMPGRLNADPSVLARRLANLSCPTLLLAGEASWMVEPTRHMAALTPQAQLAIIPDAGHWIPLDNPSAFLATVREFLGAEG